MSEQQDRREIWSHMRVPAFAAGSLLCFLLAIVLLGTIAPGRAASFIEAGLAICKMLTVLLFSMEVRNQPDLMRLYACFGFAWLSVLAGMTMVDYWTR